MLKKKKWDTNYTKNNWRNENESFSYLDVKEEKMGHKLHEK